MLDRMAVGDLPPKHHVRHTSPTGNLYWEQCVTRRGFDGPYSILYHEHAPHHQLPADLPYGWKKPEGPTLRTLQKRHVRTQAMEDLSGPPVNARRAITFNDDVVVHVLRPDADDPVYVSNADGDELIFVLEGGGLLRSSFGDLRFEKHDYLLIPKGVIYRLLPDPGAQYWLSFECPGGLNLPAQWRNDLGQLRMDAPCSHRDFRRPEFIGPIDEGIRELVVKRGGNFAGFHVPHSPLDVVGWDGTVYPLVFPIHAFQPRVGQVHLPPDTHGTFATPGALICSFVPRTVDFHEQAVPCPYPHSSVDCDELLFYCSGDFTSRRGVGPGSVSMHPAGLPHGPHPGAYEASVGSVDTNELAVMMDTDKPLQFTHDALAVDDQDYMRSFVA